jgi:tRNA modification GTPase
MVTWYPGPHSYTGDDVVELSVHGGMLAPRVTLEQCLRHGARMAGPGEFTLRAFLAGRMDLSQAEAVIDTIQAHSRAALRLAHRQLSGSTRDRVAQARDAVIGILATIEASVDFPEDVDEPDRSLMALSIEDVISMLGKILADSKAGQIYRDGIRLAIVGRPNVGKSSILNACPSEVCRFGPQTQPAL